MSDRNIERRDGYIVVTPDDIGTCIPLACPVCNLVMGTREDLSVYSTWSCCTWCKDMFAKGSIAETKWHKGWRPEPEQVESILKSMGMI